MELCEKIYLNVTIVLSSINVLPLCCKGCQGNFPEWMTSSFTRYIFWTSFSSATTFFPLLFRIVTLFRRAFRALEPSKTGCLLRRFKRNYLVFILLPFPFLILSCKTWMCQCMPSNSSSKVVCGIWFNLLEPIIIKLIVNFNWNRNRLWNYGTFVTFSFIQQFIRQILHIRLFPVAQQRFKLSLVPHF